jgi:hypothetical protein
VDKKWRSVATIKKLSKKHPEKRPTATVNTVTLSGAVSFPATATIAFGHADGTVILKAGSTVTSGTVAVLTAYSNLTIAGFNSATAALTFAATSDLTLTQVPATFGGVATFAEGKKITLSHANSVVTLNKGGSGIAVGAGRFPYNGIFQTHSTRYNVYDGRTGHIWGDRYWSEILPGEPPEWAEAYGFAPVVCRAGRKAWRRIAANGAGCGWKRGGAAGKPDRDAGDRPRTGRRTVKRPLRPGLSRRAAASHG